MNAERFERQGRVLSAVGVSGLVFIVARAVVAIAASGDEASSFLALALSSGLVVCLVVLAFAVRARARFRRAFVEENEGVPTPRSPRNSASAASPALSWGRRAIAAAACVAGIGALAYAAAPPSLKKLRWTFIEPTAAPSELGLRAHAVASGEWHLEDDTHATGARALVNREGDPAGAPALIVATSAFTRDLRAVTRCKVSPEMSARACGVVFRFHDEANYHVARLDAVAGELVVSAMSGGRERVLGRREAKAAPGIWQELGLEARAGRIRLSLNGGASTLEVVDPAPAVAGGVGLWSPAAGVAYFDELTVDPLPASAQAFELLPLLGRGRS